MEKIDQIEETGGGGPGTQKVMKCHWIDIGECRHPDWFEDTQDFLDHMSIGGVVEETPAVFRYLKESCALCILAFIGRAVNLLRITGQ